MRAAIAIARKDVIQLFRDRVGFFFVFVFPVVFGILFGVIFSGGSDGPKDVPLVIADLDQSEASQGVIELLQQESMLSIDFADDTDTAYELVRKGKRAGALIVPAGFGDELDAMFFGGDAELILRLDPGRSLESSLINGVVTGAANQQIGAIFGNNDRGRRMIERSQSALADTKNLSPVQRVALATLFRAADGVFDMADAETDDSAGEDAAGGFRAPRIVNDSPDEANPDTPKPPGTDNAFEITFAQAVAWGLMSCVLGFGLGVVGERSRGTLTRLRLSPISPGQIIMGKALACFVTCLGVQAFILAIGVVVFGVNPDSWLLLAIGVLCSCVAFVGLAMLLASFGKSETATEGLSRAVLLVLALVGGAGVPLAIMPGWVRDFASISPFKWVIQALDGAIWRQWTVSELLASWGVLVGIGVVGFAIGVVLFRRSTD